MILLPTGDGWTAFEVTLRERKLVVTRHPAPATSLPPQALRRALVGVPWEQVICRHVTLPLLVGRELRRALELQLSFHCPGLAGTGYTGTQTRTHTRGVEAVLLGVSGTAVPGGDRVVPEPLAWLALAQQLGLVPAQGSALIVHAGRGRLQTVLTVDGEIGLIRDLPLPSEPVLELRLASQALYLRGAPEAVTPAQIVWFGDPALIAKLPAALKDTVRQVAPDELLVAPGSGNEADANLCAAGLSLCRALPKPWRTWTLRAGQPGGESARAWHWAGVATAAAVLLSGLAAWTALDLARNRVAALNARQKTIAPAYAQSVNAEGQVKGMNAFLKDTGAALSSPAQWREFIHLLGANRAGAVHFTAIGGVSGDPLSVTGRADRYDDVTDTMNALQKSGHIQDLTLVSTHQIPGGVEFSFTMRFDGLRKAPPPATPAAPAGKAVNETE